ncbi:MAG: VOC family protein [Clostridiales bacterium]|nr:VOC family protein [Clostridiales bacterium]
MHIRHVTFRVRDLERSIRFYQEIAQLRVARRFRAEPAELAFLTHGEGETEIELLHIPGGQAFEGKGMFICFETDQLDRMHELAVKKGLNPSPIQVPGDGTRYFYVYDPDGVSVQLRCFPGSQA